MSLIKRISILYKTKFITPVGIIRLLAAMWKHGTNMMALLEYAARAYGDQVALVDEQETLTYKQLLEQSEQLAQQLREQYDIRSEQRVAFICHNHACLVKSIFAVSRLGADIYLLNAEMSSIQLQQLVERYEFHVIVYDREQASKLEQSKYRRDMLLSYHDELPSIQNLLTSHKRETSKLQRAPSGKLMLLTGGTTGAPKTAAHQPSIIHYLNPFIALIARLELQRYHTAYSATPIYHGYGVGTSLLFMALGKKMVIRKRFDTKEACALIQEHQVEVVTVVPLMLHKMLQHDAARLSSLACIASGSAPLYPKLIEETRSQLGDIVYNLYGTSEAGLCIIASPQDLKESPITIGRCIEGVQLSVVDEQRNEVENGIVGQLCIWTGGGRNTGSDPWIDTGDLGYRDVNGLYYLCGRVDDRIVSAGVNVYPIELEQVLIRHPYVEDVAVVGVRDEHFGQRLKAFVLLKENTRLTQSELTDWLRSRVARYQMPKEVTIVKHMPYTPIGKCDKKQLLDY